ncbi:MAG: alpha/beta hydrolase [Candidatus Kapabacteria bacterium]|jgi:acetyl esterase/lipase|nr:alpha/beta hydrolase [Candidatus Kapabacteria bacterium]
MPIAKAAAQRDENRVLMTIFLCFIHFSRQQRRNPRIALTTLGKKFLGVSLVLLSLATVSAAAQQFVPPTETGIVYGNVGGKDMLLDIYVPSENPQKPTFPVILWLHGGSWFSGNKNGFGVNYAASMVKSGFVVVCANYVTNERFPTQLHNCKAVIRWIRANAARFKIDTTKIGVWGEGAGGHLAALLGCSGDVKTATSGDVTIEIEGAVGPYIGFSSRVHAVVDLYGPTDFLKMDDAPVEDCATPIIHSQPTSPEALLMGAAIKTIPDKVKLANPIFYVTPDDPPFLIQHGTVDCNVPPNQSELLDEALNKAGVSSTLDLLDGYRHWDSGFYSFGNLRRIRLFFEQAFAPKPAASSTQEDNSR